jgi:two-component system, chemotaxis family, chemotaxis protein CheY
MSPLVLVVDDDPDILDAICDILESEGYRVSRARHGQEALQRVDDERPAIILLDLMMPVMDGVTFAQRLRDRAVEGTLDGTIPIVVISAEGNPQKVAAVGAAGYLAKPFDIETLLSQVALMTSSPSSSGSGATA